jgi:nicotinate-nucleotide adenylyltransferase
VFGGAFDPPHIAHMTMAEVAIRQLNLDALYVVPTGQAWHKSRQLTPARHRLAMTRLAFGEIPGTVVDEREILRSGPSYTVDTLLELQAEHPGAALYLVMGEDQSRAFATWRYWQQIVKLAIICVAARADSAGAMGQFSKEIVPGVAVQRLRMPPNPVSATQIRQHQAENHSTSALVFESVARYIDSHHLYQTD